MKAHDVDVFRIVGESTDKYGCAAERPDDTGLTLDGKRLLNQAGEYGVIVDLAHASPRTISDAIAHIDKESLPPFMISHATCATIAPDDPHAITDEILREIANQGGYIGIRAILGKDGRVDANATEAQFAHAIQVVGPDHLGIGSTRSYADMPGMIECIPEEHRPMVSGGALRDFLDEAWA